MSLPFILAIIAGVFWTQYHNYRENVSRNLVRVNQIELDNMWLTQNSSGKVLLSQNQITMMEKSRADYGNLLPRQKEAHTELDRRVLREGIHEVIDRFFDLKGRIINSSKYVVTEIGIEIILKDGDLIVARTKEIIFMAIPPGEARDFKSIAIFHDDLLKATSWEHSVIYIHGLEK